MKAGKRLRLTPGTKLMDLSWWDLDQAVDVIANALQRRGIENVYGVPRGGLPMAVKLSFMLRVPLITEARLIGRGTLVVDDVLDTGDTLRRILGRRRPAAVAVWFWSGRAKPPGVYVRRYIEGVQSPGFPWGHHRDCERFKGVDDV